MIQTPMSDQMIAAGQGEELEQMMKTYVPMARLGGQKRSRTLFCGYAVQPQAT